MTEVVTVFPLFFHVVRLVGLTLARLGCDVVLTEVDQPLPTLRANVARNFNRAASTEAVGKPAAPRVERLVWACEADLARVLGIGVRGYDAVVATDVNHDPEMVRRSGARLGGRAVPVPVPAPVLHGGKKKERKRWWIFGLSSLW